MLFAVGNVEKFKNHLTSNEQTVNNIVEKWNVFGDIYKIKTG